MGNVTSRIGESEGGALYLKDQTRFSIAAVTITNSRGRTLLHVSPTEFPAARYAAKRDNPDDPPVDYVLDPDSAPSSPPSFLLRLQNDDDLLFTFSIIVRQPSPSFQSTAPNVTSINSSLDTVINGLTFMFAPTLKDLDNLITREIHSDPNLHKNNPNVQLIGDYSTSGNKSVQFQFTWKWKPPRPSEEKKTGWRTCCSFVEYDQRNHRLDPLASFSFWVMNPQRPTSSPKSPVPRLEPGSTVKLRVPSAQSIESRISDSDGGEFYRDAQPQSPPVDPIPEDEVDLEPSVSGTTAVSAIIDVSCQRPGEDVTAVEDGPLFRATMKAMELKTGNMRTRWKKVLKKAETAYEAQSTCSEAFGGLMDALREAASSNAHAVQPAMDHYFDKIAKEILANDRRNTYHLHKMIIEPISKLYNLDIKQAESKKRDFEEESKEFYAFVSRYLGQRQDSLKEKRRVETDTKYQVRRRNFELKRFDYSSYLQDLHGGRKDQEVLSNLTKFADTQAKGYLDTAKKIEVLLPQLEALNSEVKEADKEYQMHRTEREEKRRALEKSAPSFAGSEGLYQGPLSQAFLNGMRPPRAENEQARGNIGLGRSASQSMIPTSNPMGYAIQSSGPPSQNQGLGLSSSPSNKFKGIRDLEERDHSVVSAAETESGHYRKEGLVWALSRPGSHVDPKGLNKQAWHKFWIVLDQGKLSEYNNWKEKLELHADPIDLRVASVREARNADRRFCFEVITPQFTRVYQAPSEEDVTSWIMTINNALQNAVEGKGLAGPVPSDSPSGSIRKDIASVLTGKSASTNHRSAYGGNKTVSRHATVGDRPSYHKQQFDRQASNESSQKLLQTIRDADASNKFCADCDSDSKVDWVSINLGVIICIECSGIHRSLGTHVTKVRSLTLDPNAFTPDVIELLLTIGNRVSNMVWEAKLDRSLKPSPQSTREQRLRFITAKYVERAYVQPITASLSHYASADETLIASIKKNDIQNVLYAIALHANPNAVDRSRSTHAVFLALAAADPASPSGTASPTTSPGAKPQATTPRKAFPVAELLLLNGAEVPLSPSPIPLTIAARLYLEGKNEQKNGRKPSTTPAPVGGTSSRDSVSGVSQVRAPLVHSKSAQAATVDSGVGTGGDTLTALPYIPPGTSNVGSPNERRKRMSSGGRLVKPNPGPPGSSGSSGSLRGGGNDGTPF